MYTKAITSELIELWLAIFKNLPADVFGYALQQHLLDPDQGRWFPTPAHILRHIIGTEDDAAARYALEFDDHPGCDGTPSFDVDRETHVTRAARRKNWIAQNLARWRTASAEQKIQHALTQKSLHKKIGSMQHARLN